MGKSGTVVHLITWVDDFYYIGRPSDVYELRDEVRRVIDMKEQEPKWLNDHIYTVDFVGIEWRHDISTGALRLSLLEYMTKLLKRFGVTGPKRSTPIDKTVAVKITETQHPLYKDAI